MTIVFSFRPAACPYCASDKLTMLRASRECVDYRCASCAREWGVEERIGEQPSFTCRA